MANKKLSKENLWNFSEFESWPKYMFPADTWLNNNVIITWNDVATLGRRNNDVIQWIGQRQLQGETRNI